VTIGSPDAANGIILSAWDYKSKNRLMFFALPKKNPNLTDYVE
jgi:hypothetical protein